MALPVMHEWIEGAKAEPDELEELDVEFCDSRVLAAGLRSLAERSHCQPGSYRAPTISGDPGSAVHRVALRSAGTRRSLTAIDRAPFFVIMIMFENLRPGTENNATWLFHHADAPAASQLGRDPQGRPSVLHPGRQARLLRRVLRRAHRRRDRERDQQLSVSGDADPRNASRSSSRPARPICRKRIRC